MPMHRRPACGRALEIAPEAAIVVDVSDAVVEVLAAGGGIGMAASWIAAPHVRRGALVSLLTDLAVDRPVISAVWPESRRGHPNVKTFVSCPEEVFDLRQGWKRRAGRPAFRRACVFTQLHPQPLQPPRRLRLRCVSDVRSVDTT